MNYFKVSNSMKHDAQTDGGISKSSSRLIFVNLLNNFICQENCKRKTFSLFKKKMRKVHTFYGHCQFA